MVICLANDWISFEKAAMEYFVSNLNVSFIPFNRPDINHFGFSKSVATGSGCVRDTSYCNGGDNYIGFSFNNNKNNIWDQKFLEKIATR